MKLTPEQQAEYDAEVTAYNAAFKKVNAARKRAGLPQAQASFGGSWAHEQDFIKRVRDEKTVDKIKSHKPPVKTNQTYYIVERKTGNRVFGTNDLDEVTKIYLSEFDQDSYAAIVMVNANDWMEMGFAMKNPSDIAKNPSNIEERILKLIEDCTIAEEIAWARCKLIAHELSQKITAKSTEKEILDGLESCKISEEISYKRLKLLANELHSKLISITRNPPTKKKTTSKSKIQSVPFSQMKSGQLFRIPMSNDTFCKDNEKTSRSVDGYYSGQKFNFSRDHKCFPVDRITKNPSSGAKQRERGTREEEYNPSVGKTYSDRTYHAEEIRSLQVKNAKKHDHGQKSVDFWKSRHAKQIELAKSERPILPNPSSGAKQRERGVRGLDREKLLDLRRKPIHSGRENAKAIENAEWVRKYIDDPKNRREFHSLNLDIAREHRPILPNPKSEWMVTVGNVGTVYNGGSKLKAEKTYKEYVDISKSNHGRAGGEEVTLWRDGEPVKEYDRFSHLRVIKNPDFRRISDSALRDIEDPELRRIAAKSRKR